MSDKDKEKDKKKPTKRDREIQGSFAEATRSRTKPGADQKRYKELIGIFERILRGTDEEYRRGLIDELGLKEGSPEFEEALRFRADFEF